MIIQIYKNIASYLVVPVMLCTVILYFLEQPVDVFESFVRDYRGTIISIGTLVLISALALWTAGLSSSAADRREKFNRRVESELQISKFRQAWIGEMRNDLAELIQLAFHAEHSDDIARGFYLHTKIEMRLNLEEPLADKLSQDLGQMIIHDLDDNEQNKARADATVSGQMYLKNVWRRLKQDIREAQLFGNEIV